MSSTKRQSSRRILPCLWIFGSFSISNGYNLLQAFALQSQITARLPAHQRSVDALICRWIHSSAGGFTHLHVDSLICRWIPAGGFMQVEAPRRPSTQFKTLQNSQCGDVPSTRTPLKTLRNSQCGDVSSRSLQNSIVWHY
jgi:hypothetical protein